jgi:hypothetical protein
MNKSGVSPKPGLRPNESKGNLLKTAVVEKEKEKEKEEKAPPLECF